MVGKLFKYIFMVLLSLQVVSAPVFANCSMDMGGDISSSSHEMGMDHQGMDHSDMAMAGVEGNLQNCDCISGMGHCLVSTETSEAFSIVAPEVEKSKAIKPIANYGELNAQSDKDIYFPDIPPPKIKTSLHHLSVLLLI